MYKQEIENGLQIKKDAASLLIRSGYNHLRYIRPDARRHDLYAGKDVSAATTAMFDLLAITPRQIPSRRDFFTALNGFNTVWRAYDEVVDEKNFVLNPEKPVTDVELDTTPVYHKYLRRTITGEEGRMLALDAMARVIPGKDRQSRSRRDDFERILFAYRSAVRNMANNPNYQTGDILPYPTALQSKRDITGFLGEVGVQLTTILAGLPRAETIERIYGELNVAMQFGDDLLDWRKDRKGHAERKESTSLPIRPDENLFNATAIEYPEEREASAEVLTDKTTKSIVWARRVAPHTLREFIHRFQTQLDGVPNHQRGDTLKRIYGYTFYHLLPRLPETGRFARWAKY